ncbi:polysaccharide pyruvyl transferase family protein [Bacteroides thetaiotaomicron]|nr:polysaccharide pyruvyl transferase family protein [Bacteroides thetaiotaomicron]
MKIGILTFANVPNFGANLQALSTISYLQNHGYNPILIKWEPEDFEARFTSIKTQKQPQEHFHFVEKYLPQTKICRNDDDICQVIKDEKIEGIIIGSDAVLQCSSFGVDWIFQPKQLYVLIKLHLNVSILMLLGYIL